MHNLTCIEVFEEPLLKAALLHTVSGCPGMSIFEYSTTLIRQLRKARIMQKAGEKKKKIRFQRLTLQKFHVTLNLDDLVWNIADCWKSRSTTSP